MKKFAYVFIAAVMLLGIVGSTVAAQGDVLFDADFNNGKMPSDIDASKGWKIVKDGRDVVLHATTADSAEAAIISAGTDWTDYSFEVKMKLIEGSALFTARVSGDQSLCNGYGVLVRGAESLVSLLKLDDQCNSDVLDSITDFKTIRDDWMDLKFDLVGSQLSVSVDDSQILSAKDTTHDQGLPTMILLPNSEVEIDSVTVTALENSSGPINNNPSTVTLTQFDSDSSSAIGELQDLGLVPSGGALLFQENHAFFKGIGDFFTPLARRSPHTDIVMAGELTFTIGSTKDYEACMLTARIGTNSQGTATTYTDVRINNSGDLDIVDVSKSGQKATTAQTFPLALDLTQPHHLMIVMIGESVTVFVDGQMAAQDVPVVQRKGTYGIALIGKGKAARCDGNNIWVYNFD